ncbi:MAG: dephospho-CoA kinase [Pseudomonadota bacterium]
MIIVGLTGSIGMGKSTTADFFRAAKVPVHDADATVHDLYRNEAVGPVGRRFPGTVQNGEIDRARLSAAVLGDKKAMQALEAIVHPLVREREQRFLREAREQKAPLVILDIPLLFETGADARVDKIVVVTAPPEIQRQRVLSRPGMTEQKFQQILARQTPDDEKRRRADFVIDTSFGFDHARNAVEEIVKSLRAA